MDQEASHSELNFYHSIDIPGHGTIQGTWDLRDCFDDYVGRVPLAGKTVLDVGTATGFLAFEAEKHGATVTAFDLASASEQRMIPFAGSEYLQNRRAWNESADMNLQGLRDSFAFCHEKLGSKVRAIHSSFPELSETKERFDVVIAGAILEHISDPVSALGVWCKLAKETVVVASTPFIMSDEVFMRPLNDWSDPRYDYTWYELSMGMFRRVFANLGFRITRVTYANMRYPLDGGILVERPTIVAERI